MISHVATGVSVLAMGLSVRFAFIARRARLNAEESAKQSYAILFAARINQRKRAIR